MLSPIRVSNFLDWTTRFHLGLATWPLWVWSFFPGPCYSKFAFPTFPTGRPLSTLASQLGPFVRGTLVCFHAVHNSRFQLYRLDVPFPPWSRHLTPVGMESLSAAGLPHIRVSNFLDWTSRFHLGLVTWSLWVWIFFPGPCCTKFAFPTFWTGRPVSALASQLCPCGRGVLVCCQAVPNSCFQLFGLNVPFPPGPRNLAPVGVDLFCLQCCPKFAFPTFWTGRSVSA